MKVSCKFELSTVVMALLLSGGLILADEGQPSYLSSDETVERVYAHLNKGDLVAASEYLQGLGDDKQVVQTWINVQCDINNIKQNAHASAEIGLAGVDYCLERGYKIPAAIMLHNISAFFMPNFDEGVDPAYLPIILNAARRQVSLRREINQPEPLAWALWDLGLAELAASNAEAAIRALEEGEKIDNDNGDRDAAAWCRLFIGKTRSKLIPNDKTQGKQDMREAVKIIDEIGQDWEKEEVGKILESMGIENQPIED